MTDIRLVLPAAAAWAASALSLVVIAGVHPIEERHATATIVSVIAFIGGALGLIACRRQPSLFVIIAATAVATFSAATQFMTWTAPAFSEAMNSPVQVRAEVDGPLRTALGVAYLPVRTELVTTETSRGVRVPITLALAEGQFEATEGATAWPVGSVIAVEGRLRPAGGSIRTAGYLDVADPSTIQVIAAAGVIDQLAERMRQGLQASLPATPSAGAALVAGLAIGDEEAMSPELVDQMRASGLAHLTAVSGGNVAIVVGAVLLLAWVLRLPMVLRIAIALAALVFYVVLVHPQPSVLRAGVMGAVVVVSLLIGGRRPGPSVLATAVLVLVIVVPSLALSWGFALSVAATAGIVMVAPVIRARMESTPLGERLPPAVTIGASLTLAAQLATAPVLLAMGVSVGAVSVPANVLAMPAVPAVTIAGLAAAIFGSIPVAAPLADATALVGAWIAEWIAQIARIASEVDLLRFDGSPMIAGFAVSLAVLAVLAWRRGRRRSVLAIASLAAVVTCAWALFPPGQRSWPPSNWALVQCDVGQGDALVIAGDEGAVVIDTGNSAREIDRCLSDLHIDHVAALVLTHFHADHVAGLPGVLAGRRVDAVFATVWDEPSAQSRGVQRVLGESAMALRRLTAGAQFTVGDGAYSVLWPRRIIKSGQLSSGSVANNASVVLDARVKGLRVLLTGDIEPPAQAALFAMPGGFDVVKVPHHGSRHQHPRFAGWVDPVVALISAGRDNEFGHPAESTVQAWREIGAVVARTDEHGDIAIARRSADEQVPGAGWEVVPRRGAVS